jgi:hypothetical protein
MALNDKDQRAGREPEELTAKREQRQTVGAGLNML